MCKLLVCFDAWDLENCSSDFLLLGYCSCCESMVAAHLMSWKNLLVIQFFFFFFFKSCPLTLILCRENILQLFLVIYLFILFINCIIFLIFN